jgi:hypothetical protein
VRRVATFAAAVLVGAFWAAALPNIVRASSSDGACLVAALDQARADAGLAALTVDGTLTSIAAGHSSAMASAGTLSHNPTLPDQAPPDWVDLGENVGEGPSCGSIAAAFMGDAEHRGDILDRSFSAVGVGAVAGAGGTLWVTEDFMATASVSVPASTQVAAAVPAPAAPPAHPSSPSSRLAATPPAPTPAAARAGAGPAVAFPTEPARLPTPTSPALPSPAAAGAPFPATPLVVALAPGDPSPGPRGPRIAHRHRPAGWLLRLLRAGRSFIAQAL